MKELCILIIHFTGISLREEFRSTKLRPAGKTTALSSISPCPVTCSLPQPGTIPKAHHPNVGPEPITLIYPWHESTNLCVCVCVCVPHLCVHIHAHVHTQRWLRAGKVSHRAFLYWLHVKSCLLHGNSGHLRARVLIVHLCIPSSLCRVYNIVRSQLRDHLNQVPEGRARRGSLK